MATFRSSTESVASRTRAIPPLPSVRSMRYLSEEKLKSSDFTSSRPKLSADSESEFYGSGMTNQRRGISVKTELKNVAWWSLLYSVMNHSVRFPHKIFNLEEDPLEVCHWGSAYWPEEVCRLGYRTDENRIFRIPARIPRVPVCRSDCRPPAG